MDHLICGGKQHGWNGDAERFGRFAVDNKLELCQLSIGSSSGFAPCKTLSTYVAARCVIAFVSGP
jgi:hypothetical protein